MLIFSTVVYSPTSATVEKGAQWGTYAILKFVQRKRKGIHLDNDDRLLHIGYIDSHVCQTTVVYSPTSATVEKGAQWGTYAILKFVQRKRKGTRLDNDDRLLHIDYIDNHVCQQQRVPMEYQT